MFTLTQLDVHFPKRSRVRINLLLLANGINTFQIPLSLYLFPRFISFLFPLSDMAVPNPKMEKKLVPTPATNFPGSFAAELRQDNRKYAEIRSLRSILQTYFTDGWNNVDIWKSAVRSQRYFEVSSLTICDSSSSLWAQQCYVTYPP